MPEQTASGELIPGLEEKIVELSADAILAADAKGTIRFWNPGAARIFGYPSEEAVGASLDIIIPERLRARHWDGWDHVIASGSTRYGSGDLLSVPALTKDGRQISVEFTIALLRDDVGRIIGMAAILRDVTARFEEMRRLRKALSERGAART